MSKKTLMTNSLNPNLQFLQDPQAKALGKSSSIEDHKDIITSNIS